MYIGREGHWAWLLHRVTGLAVMLFLGLHILDTALIGFGPDAYNHALSIYRLPVIRVMEVLLALAVLYHAGNGLRITLIDFWPSLARYHRPMFWIGAIIYPLIAIPMAYVMLKPVFKF